LNHPTLLPDLCADALGGDIPADHLLNQSGALLPKRLHRRSIHPRNSVNPPGLDITAFFSPPFSFS
jgi:hypothetical protein